MIRKVNRFFMESYHSDKLSFYLEMTNFTFSVIGSLLLAITARHPDMRIIFPIFLVGSVAQTYASYRRRASWVMMTTGYFTVTNIIGLIRAFGLM